MIKINKSRNIPNILGTLGALETGNLIGAFNSSPSDFTSRVGVPVNQVFKMEFDADIYGAAAVKGQLVAEQHDKCCFCEAKFSDNSYGDVEHYRPKKAYKKVGATSLTYPGYYWLAYEWANLMYSCEKCNRKYKRNDFPLRSEQSRVRNHKQKNRLNREERLLINPMVENPGQFITFIKEVPVPRRNSLKGKTSIAAYGLERLNDTRLEHIILLEGLLAFYNINPTSATEVGLAMGLFKFTRQQVLDKIADATKYFHSAAKPKAKFTLCVRSNFPYLPQ